MVDLSIYAWTSGFLVTFATAVLIVLTKPFHGFITFDDATGLQKFHTDPTPRIGGVALIFGYLTAFLILDGALKMLWGMIGLAGIPAFVFGLAEDVTRRVSVRIRLIATTASGLLFVLITGYSITYVDIWGADTLLAISAVSIAFTAFAIAGIANAINIIDGFHGLASGTVIIILSAFAIVSWRVGDTLLLELSLLLTTIVIGFFLMNFPFGKLFLGDSGAYFLGYLVATLAIMLPARNPEISPWVSLLILGYPLIETIISIIRKSKRNGHHPGAADRVHLHMLIYRSAGRRLAKKAHRPHLRSAITSTLMWGLSVVILLSVTVSDLSTLTSIVSLGIVALLYIILYRRVALLRRRP